MFEVETVVVVGTGTVSTVVAEVLLEIAYGQAVVWNGNYYPAVTWDMMDDLALASETVLRSCHYPCSIRSHISCRDQKISALNSCLRSESLGVLFNTSKVV
jgi:hypothetical protein